MKGLLILLWGSMVIICFILLIKTGNMEWLIAELLFMILAKLEG